MGSVENERRPLEDGLLQDEELRTVHWTWICRHVRKACLEKQHRKLESVPLHPRVVSTLTPRQYLH